MTSPTIQRLDEEITWYERRARTNQVLYKGGKIIVIVAAALIPFVSGLPRVETWYIGALGVLIAIVEGVQQLNQHHANWISYRATCEALKHEKYLHLAGAGPYADTRTPGALLAERVEALVSQETGKWASSQEKLDQRAEGSKKARAETQK
jgi:Protein of unknown function (DUF4231)